MNAASPNKLFFETTSITITDTRFDTGRDSFPIRKISGVRVESGKRHTRTGISLVVAGLAALLSGMLGNVAVLIVLGAAFTVGGAILCVARVNRTLVITTRGRDVSPDE